MPTTQKTIRYVDITVSRYWPTGAYECAAMVNGYRVRRTFYVCTKREALRMFYDGVNSGEIE